MKPVRAVAVVEAPGIEAEQLWFDPSRWASWLQGFSHLVSLDDGWPVDGRRIYDGPRRAGAGADHALHRRLRVLRDDRGLAHVRRDQRAASRPTTCARGSRVELDVEPKEKLAPGPRWWLRRKLGQEWALTLQRFAYELAAER